MMPEMHSPAAAAAAKDDGDLLVPGGILDPMHLTFKFESALGPPRLAGVVLSQEGAAGREPQGLLGLKRAACVDACMRQQRCWK